MNNNDKIRITELVLRSFEEDISEQEFADLTHILKISPEHVDYYKSIVRIYQQLFEHGDIISSAKGDVEDVLDEALWVSLAENEKIAPAVEMAEKVSQEPLTDVRQRKQQLRKELQGVSFNTPLFITTITAIAALVFVIVFIKLVPRRAIESVATVKNCSGIQFAVNEDIEIASRLTNRKAPYWLQKGLLEIEFDYGAALVIEGPAAFRIVSPEKICLDTGRVYARVPGSAKGFTVDTPNSTVIDLGTEFGVQVEIDGTSSVHMLKGRASLIPGPKGNTGEFQMLTTGQANRVDLEGNVQNIPLLKNRFVRRIFSGSGMAWRGQNLNLADILGGGNGFGTGNQDYGIIIETGKPSQGPLTITGHGIRSEKTWDSFCPISQISVIDGIFIPDSNPGPTIVSSQGHIFHECPDTNGCWSGPITNGAKTIEGNYTPIVDDLTYGTPQNPALFMHANIGITYDLNKIRAILPNDQPIGRFTSMVLTPRSSKNHTLDVWVLVDGQVRFSKTSIDSSAPFYIDVPLAPQEHFLSLIVTDGIDKKIIDENKNVFNWCFFCRPELVLETN